jgi:hypothetical protein
MQGGARNAIREYRYYQSAQVKVTFGHPSPLLLLSISNHLFSQKKEAYYQGAVVQASQALPCRYPAHP